MTTYSNNNKAPWDVIKEKIQTISLNGITYISDFAFLNFTRLVSISFGNELSSIGKNPFIGCSSLIGINPSLYFKYERDIMIYLETQGKLLIYICHIFYIF